MKLECVKDKLKEAVLFAEKITGKSQSIPILQSILLTTEGKTLKVRATNLDIGVEFEIPAKIERKGIISVPGGVLANTLIGLQDAKNISIDLVNNNLFLSTERTSTTIKSYQPDDFPTLPIVKEGEPIVIPGKKLTEGLRSVLFSASSSDIKPEIASVFVYSDGEQNKNQKNKRVPEHYYSPEKRCGNSEDHREPERRYHPPHKQKPTLDVLRRRIYNIANH